MSRRALFTAGFAAVAGVIARAVPGVAASEPLLLGEKNRTDLPTTLTADDRALALLGGTAQLRLIPNNLASHPHKGLAGDLVMDGYRRLWLCKGGVEWVRLA